MNAMNAYRKSMVTAPTHTLLSKLHEQAGVFTQNAKRFADEGDVEAARKNIQYVEDIIAFLRSSLDMSLEASQKTDSVYAYYYGIMVNWYLTVSETPESYQTMLDFWQSWAETWMRAAGVKDA